MTNSTRVLFPPHAPAASLRTCIRPQAPRAVNQTMSGSGGLASFAASGKSAKPRKNNRQSKRPLIAGQSPLPPERLAGTSPLRKLQAARHGIASPARATLIDVQTTAAGIDPARADHVGPALLRFVAAHLAAPAARFAEPPEPVTYGWDTYIYTFRLDADGLPPGARAAWAGPLVLRLYADAAQFPRAETEVAIQRFVVERGYPAARPLAVIDTPASPFALPFVIMERLPGEPMLNPVARNPLRAWSSFASFAALHAGLHRLDPAGWPLPEEGPFVERTLALLRDDIERFQIHQFDARFAWLEAHKSIVIPEQRSICHGDFHPLNVLTDGRGRLSVVDWGMAFTGDRHADVANALVELTLVPTTSLSLWQRVFASVARRMAARRYVACYDRHLPLDRARLRYWEALFTLRWLVQFSAVLEHGAAALGLKPETTAYIRPSHLETFRRHFDRLTRG